MWHEAKDNVYILYSENDEILLRLEIVDNEQVIIETDTQRFAGPIKLLEIM